MQSEMFKISDTERLERVKRVLERELKKREFVFKNDPVRKGEKMLECEQAIHDLDIVMESIRSTT